MSEIGNGRLNAPGHRRGKAQAAKTQNFVAMRAMRSAFFGGETQRRAFVDKDAAVKAAGVADDPLAILILSDVGATWVAVALRRFNLNHLFNLLYDAPKVWRHGAANCSASRAASASISAIAIRAPPPAAISKTLGRADCVRGLNPRKALCDMRFSDDGGMNLGLANSRGLSFAARSLPVSRSQLSAGLA
jgi:hypothetical protein